MEGVKSLIDKVESLEAKAVENKKENEKLKKISMEVFAGKELECSTNIFVTNF